MKARLSIGLVILLTLLAAVPGQAQGPESQISLGTPFTYQGILRSGNIPVSGSCDFQFSLWDSASGGAQIGSMWPQAGVAVTRGLFTVALDFGAAPFQGANRYLEVAVRCPAGSGGYTTMTPRQPLTPTPYALYAAAGQWAGLLGIPAGFADNVDNDTTYSAGDGLKLIGTQFSAVFAGTGAANTVARSDHDHDARYWKLSGNSGTTPGINYLGTSDNTILEIKVNNLRALRLEPSAISPNIVGGYPGNNVIPGGVGGTVSGGGAPGLTNRVTDSYGAVSGGIANQAGNGNVDLADAGYSFVGGGEANTAGGSRSTVSGGFSNAASAWGATVPGGTKNTAAGMNSLAAGNRAKANHTSAFVWADSTDADFASTAENQFAVRAAGGVWFTSVLGDMFRMLPNSTAPNIIGGYQGNSITAGVAGATIAGGGISTGFNIVTDQHGTIGGGAGNTSGNSSGTTIDAGYATIAGGWRNIASGAYASIGGGRDHAASAMWSTIGGGYQNAIDVSGGAGTIGGGMENLVYNQASTIAGGERNSATGGRATVGGGKDNTAAGGYSTVAGGQGNSAQHLHAAIGGGAQNLVQAQYATVSGGYTNTVAGNATAATIGGGNGNTVGSDSTAAVIGGGEANAARASRVTIGGGRENIAIQMYSTISGGYQNLNQAQYATISGGYTNTIGAGSTAAAIGGGQGNEATASFATVGGGYDNAASGNFATAPGGKENEAAGMYSFAAGRRAKALNSGCFVWGDSNDADISCAAVNRWMARASGGVYFYTNSALTSGMYLAAGGSAWNAVSDRSLKENFSAVDGREVLARLADIPITTWNYKAQDSAIRHVGPMAQDFNRLVEGLGGEGATYINTLDADGVALAALQGAYQLIQEKDARIAAQQAQIDDLETRLNALEALVATMAKGEER